MHLSEILRLERSLILFDLETTGTDPQSARIVEFGMFWYRPGIVEPERYQTLVQPNVNIPADASGAHGITTDVLRVGCARCRAPKESHPHEECSEWKSIPRWRDIAPHIHRGFQNADFAGYNIYYDLRVTSAEMEREGLTFDYSTAYVLDAKRIWQILEPRTLSDAVEYFGKRKHVNAHGALPDVIGTEIALIGQFTAHERSHQLPRTMRELHELCFPRDPNWIDSEGKFIWINGKACFGFGKHQGKPVTCDVGYLRWMQGGGFSPEVKRLIGEWLNGQWPQQTELPL